MKINELRIGNCILIDCIMYKEERKVTEICPDGVFAKTKYTANMPEIVFIKEEDIEPIELTEEVLLKIGFKKDGNNYSLVCGDIEVGYYIDKFKQVLYINVSREKRFYKNELRSYDVKYLHELQNAYYCLTGKELEVEL